MKDRDPGSFTAGTLEQRLGRPRERWTADDLVMLCREDGIGMLSLMHVGGDGWLKTLDFVPRSESHLRDVLEGGERADGSSIFHGTGIRTEASDILLRPRISSAFLDPFARRPQLAVLCSHDGRDGRPLPESPDTIVRRAAERVTRETGTRLMALGEVEYFLGKRREESDIYGADDRGYHATAPFVFGEGLRRDAMKLLSEIGVAVKYGHSEVGFIESDGDDGRIWEQHEIELELAPLPEAADAVALVQWVLRNLAHSRQMLCTFEPIVRQGHAGSGLHFHLSPVRDGAYLGGRDHTGELHASARWLIGALVRMGDALMAFGNRRENSFVRLTQGKEAPNAFTWGEFDRKALVRLPVLARARTGELISKPTVEFRLPDGSCHPHLLLAAVGQAMLDASTWTDLDEVLKATRSGPDTDMSAAAPVPRGFPEVSAALRNGREVFERDGVFPTHVMDRFLELLEHPRFGR